MLPHRIYLLEIRSLAAGLILSFKIIPEPVQPLTVSWLRMAITGERCASNRRRADPIFDMRSRWSVRLHGRRPFTRQCGWIHERWVCSHASGNVIRECSRSNCIQPHRWSRHWWIWICPQPASDAIRLDVSDGSMLSKKSFRIAHHKFSEL